MEDQVAQALKIGPAVEGQQQVDGELLAAVAAGDEEALATLYDRYRLLAFSLAVRVVGDPQRAEDVVQDAFLSVWRRSQTYAAARGSVKTWLATIVRNRAIDLVRARRESTSIDEEILGQIRDAAPSVIEQVATSIDRETVRDAISELPEDQRSAIAMAYFGGLSHSEIAQRTGLPLGTVKGRIRLGMERLRAALLARGLGPLQVDEPLQPTGRRPAPTPPPSMPSSPSTTTAHSHV
jgi:RNA polymerase sigma-70 factor, ECF subfamily